MSELLINNIKVDRYYTTATSVNTIFYNSIKEEFFGISTINVGGTDILCEHSAENIVKCSIVYGGKRYENIPFYIIKSDKSKIVFNERSLANPAKAEKEIIEICNSSTTEEDSYTPTDTLIEEAIRSKDHLIEKLERDLNDARAINNKKIKLKKQEFNLSLKEAVEKGVSEYRQKILEDFLYLSAEQKTKNQEALFEAIEEIKQEAEENSNIVLENVKSTTQQLLENIITANEEQARIKDEYIKNTITDIETILGEKYIESVDELKSKSQEELKQFTTQFLDNLRTKLEEQKQKELKQLQETVNDTIKNDLFIVSDRLLSEVKSETDKNLLDVYDKLESYKISVKEEIAALFEEKERIINSNLSSSFNDKLSSTRNELANLYVTSLEKTNNDLRQELNEQIAYLDSKINSKKVEQVSFDSNELVAEAVKHLIEEDDRVGNRLRRFKDTILKDLQQAAETYASNANKRMMRYAEMMSGGGSSSTQYANGGTMNGDLNVTGNINSQSMSVESLSATIINAVSANITYLDIKNYELSGFDVTGNVSISGNLETSGDISSNSIIYDQTGNSNEWNTAYDIATSYQNVSGNFATIALVNTVSSQLVTSDTFSSYQTSVAQSTATLLPTSIYQNASGDWQRTFLNVQSNSGKWENTYTEVQQGSSIWYGASGAALLGSKIYSHQNFVPLSGGAVIGDSLTISGELYVLSSVYVAGSAFYVQAQDLIVRDPIIYIAEDNQTDILDIGFMASWTNPPGFPDGYTHGGLIRRADNKTWTLFSGSSSEPLSALNVDWTQSTITLEPLSAKFYGDIYGNRNVYGTLSSTGPVYGSNLNIANWDIAFDKSTVFSSVSSRYNSSSTVVESNSANWDFGYNAATFVQANSANWEESAEILPTVTNFLSTNNVLVNTLSVSSVQIRTRPTANVFIGNSTTGRDAATGNHNFVFGSRAGNALTTGSSNNFLGYSAGRNNTSGRSNNFLGGFAGFYNTTGSFNNFFGLYSGAFNTTGSCNNFLGYYAGFSNTTGRNNNFLGNCAGRCNTTGNNNNFLGINAGFRNTTGGSNNFFGYSAGRCNTTGSCNNFIGYSAGFYNTTGNSNNFFGGGAGLSNTTGGLNNFLGNNAGRYNTTGCYNNFLGNNAGRGASYYDFSSYTTKGCARGFNNNFFGQSAGFNIDSGRHNNFFGTNAGCTNTIGWNNTIIGNGADVATNSLSGVIVLGTNAIATESHQVVLSTANVLFRSTGNTFEIGSPSLIDNLTVFGTISSTGTVFAQQGNSGEWISRNQALAFSIAL